MESQQTIGKLSATLRNGVGKSMSRKLRLAGQIPGVIYGRGQESVPLAIDPKALRRSLDPEKQRNTLIELSIATDGGTKLETVMLKDYQMDVLAQTLQHADFIRVSLDTPVNVEVPLELEGKSEGVKLGGTLHKVFRMLQVECTPDRIPARIVGDVTTLQIGHTLSVGDLVVPEGVTVALPKTQTCALVFAPRVATDEETAEGAEGAAGETPAAEGATAAAGAPAEAKPKS